jgi:hypothetical protein
MKWLTLEEIKQQLRIEADFTLEDDLLTGYGESAEETVLNVCQRTYDDFISDYGKIPQPIVDASLLLVGVSYEHRTADAITQLHNTGAFDTLVKPYMRLTLLYDTEEAAKDEEYILGSDIKILVSADLPDDLTMQDVDFTVVICNGNLKNKEKTYQKADCILTADGDYAVLVDSTELGVGRYLCRLTVLIPDTDYQTGYRKEVVKINPNVIVKG